MGVCWFDLSSCLLSSFLLKSLSSLVISFLRLLFISSNLYVITDCCETITKLSELFLLECYLNVWFALLGIILRAYTLNKAQFCNWASWLNYNFVNWIGLNIETSVMTQKVDVIIQIVWEENKRLVSLLKCYPKSRKGPKLPQPDWKNKVLLVTTIFCE